jgi:hypothetical protein
MKIYVASSWRNEYQQKVVSSLRNNGHEVYDFRNPSKNNHGFSWSEVDPNWQNWNRHEYREFLEHPIAVSGYKSDFNAMKWADVCVLVLPCGRSAHTEAGWMKGADKITIALIPENTEPELMYKIFDKIVLSITELILELDLMRQIEKRGKA